tara:strand:+ start:1043 stop:1672 length:630 start_codon:yes stop_codon:yes gene_type:complete
MLQNMHVFTAVLATIVSGCQTLTDASSQMEQLISSFAGQTNSKSIKIMPAKTDRVGASDVSLQSSNQLSGVISPDAVHSGDKFVLEGVKVSLFGNDALELGQTCKKANKTIPCGEISRNALIGFTAGQTVGCLPVYFSFPNRTGTYQYTVGSFNLSSAMVKTGLATISSEKTPQLSEMETFARQHKKSMRNTRLDIPSKWRTMHPSQTF